MSVVLTSNFLANARGMTFEDGGGITWSFNSNTNQLTANGSAAGAGAANPSASVGLSAVNGSATTFMRSDGAPALSQSIAPTWTGLHTFSAGITVTGTITLDAHTLTLTGNASITGTNTGDQTLPTAANPSASVGLSAVNGSATTFMRSDGAPALSQSIAPTMTGTWNFAPTSGLLGVGATTSGFVTANRMVAALNATTSDLIDFQVGGASAGYIYAAATEFRIAALSTSPLNLFTDGLLSLGISDAGLVTIAQLTASTGTALIESGDAVYSLTSSRDYKVNIEDANEAALANVLKLRPVYYRSNPKTTSDRPDWSWYGLIAEEVAEIDPRLVNYWDQGRGCIRKDRDGKDVVVRPRQMKPKSVGYERIAPLLIPHISRLYARIEALEAQLKEKSA